MFDQIYMTSSVHMYVYVWRPYNLTKGYLVSPNNTGKESLEKRAVFPRNAEQ